MLYPWAVPGRRVVCVNADDNGGPPLIGGYRYSPDATLDGLASGQTYTIRSVEVSPYTGKVNIRLHEITRPGEQYGLAAGYWVGRFRPLSLRTQEESVALFAHHLTQAPVSRTVETHNMEPLSNDA